MIDTLKISHHYVRPPNPSQLVSLGWVCSFNSNTEQKSWILKQKGRFPYLSIFTAPDYRTYLSANFSMPHFLFGSNSRLPNQKEVIFGLNDISEFVSQKSGLDFDAQTATVWKVHFTKDFRIEEHQIYRIISRLSQMTFPRFDRGGYSDTTLYYHSKGSGKQKFKPKTICIYGKHKERLSKSSSTDDKEFSNGILRAEFRYQTSEAVKQLAKSHNLNRQARSILTQEMSDSVLAPIAARIATILNAQEQPDTIIKLFKGFGNRRASTLIIHLLLLKLFGENFYKIEDLNTSRTAYYKAQKELREFGIFSLFDSTI